MICLTLAFASLAAAGIGATVLLSMRAGFRVLGGVRRRTSHGGGSMGQQGCLRIGGDASA